MNNFQYATKADLKNGTGVDTLVKKVDVANFKSAVGKLGIDNF